MNSATDSRPSHKRLWLWIVAGVVALLLILGLVVPLFINVDSYRPEIASAIEAATGRQATIGPIHVRLLPTAAVVVDGFQLSNPASFGPGNLLSVDEIKGGLELGPLLLGDIHLTSLSLVNPKIVLEQDEKNQDNYTFGASSGSQQSAPASQGSHHFELTEIDHVTLSNADISVLRVASAGAPPFTMFRIQKLSADIGNVTTDFTKMNQWQADAKLAGLQVELGAFAGPIVFLGGDVKLASGAVDCNFQVQAGSVADLKGTLHISNLTEPVTTFEISTPAFGADALLAGLRKTPPAATPATPQKPAELSSRLLAQGKVSADRITWSPYVGGNANAEIRIYGDHTEVWPAQVTLYGGTLQFTARTDARQNPERFSANVKLQNLDLGHMLDAGPPDLRGKMTGHADFTVELVGSAGGAWESALTGNGNFSVHDGTLPGVNLAGGLGVIAKATGLNETKFSSLAGDLEIKNGHVNSKQIKMDANAGTVELTGGFGLADKSLDFSGKATLNAAAMGGAPGEAIAGLLSAALKHQVTNLTVPFKLTGTMSHPIVLPGKALGAVSQPVTPVEQGLKKLFGKH